jgi:hypothetical protein
VPKIDPNLDPWGPSIPIWEKGQYGGRKRPINIPKLFTITQEVCNVFDGLGIRYCLSHGTILGVYRQKDVIPYDDDVDLAVFLTDKPKFDAARRILRSRGFYVPDEGDPDRPVDPRSNMPYYDFVAIKDGEKVECWFFEKQGQYWVYDHKREGLALPAKFLADPLPTIEWRGAKFPCPHDLEEYMLLMYGADWKTPRPEKKYNPLRAT